MVTRRGDVVLAVLVASVLAAVMTASGRYYDEPRPLAYVWAVGFGLLMLLRRSHPRLVLALTTLGFFSYYASGFPAIGVGVPMAVALYSAAEAGATRAAVATALVVLGLSTTYRIAVGQAAAFVLGYELVYHAALMAAAIALGHVVQVGRALRRRSAQVAGLLARQSELDAAARLRDERLNLARELHDSLGHSFAVAGLYAQVAQEAGQDQRAAREAIGHVRESVVDGLAQLRRTVALLRHPHAPTEQSPTVSDIPQLGTAPRAAGYDVSIEVPPDDVCADVSPEAAAAAYRLVQEAITNVIRHSSGSSIHVHVGLPSAGLLEVRVRDDGRGAGRVESRPGHGLSGMRERLEQLGGSLDVRADHTGWTVRATIPESTPTEGPT